MAGDLFDDPQQLAPPRTVRVGFDDGSFVLRSPEPLKPYARCTGEWLEHWARETPDAPAFAERTPDGGWRRLSWGQTRAAVGRIAQSLLGLRLAPQAPIVVLSDNALDHLLLMLAGLHIGRAVCTVNQSPPLKAGCAMSGPTGCAAMRPPIIPATSRRSAWSSAGRSNGSVAQSPQR